MYVDLRVLESYGKTAVRCTSEEQAKAFMKALWEQYPELVRGVWREGQTNWFRYGYDEEGEICYKPRIVKDPQQASYCQSTKTKDAIRDGYKIIDFSDLTVLSADFGEISTSVVDIKCLLGME